MHHAPTPYHTDGRSIRDRDNRLILTGHLTGPEGPATATYIVEALTVAQRFEDGELVPFYDVEAAEEAEREDAARHLLHLKRRLEAVLGDCEACSETEDAIRAILEDF